MVWSFEYRNIEIWGTVIILQMPKNAAPVKDFTHACDNAQRYFEEVDQLFSTYKVNSEISRLRREEVDINQCSDQVRFVWNSCLHLRELTRRAFDPWAVPGGFDPSGYVKGWAAQESLRFFAEVGITRIQINAGGDLVVRGGYDEITPWKIGIRHPDFVDQIAKEFELFDGAVASSGSYERGAHIIDPRVGVPAVGARAATVVGPDAAVADALATAVMVDGRDSVLWLGNPAFANYSFWAVDRYGDGAWSYQNAEG